MPLAKINVVRDHYSRETRRVVADSVQPALIENLGIPGQEQFYGRGMFNETQIPRAAGADRSRWRAQSKSSTLCPEWSSSPTDGQGSGAGPATAGCVPRSALLRTSPG